MEWSFSNLQSIDIHLLGDFRISFDGQPLTSLNSPRLKSLLTYLLLHRDSSQPRRYLAFLFWPDSSESQARTNLRFLLHAMRQALPDADRFISADAQTLQWNLESSYTVDFIEFEEAVAQASDSTALRKAIHLYKGPLLPDCYEDWIQPERERLEEHFTQTLERLILILEQENDFRTAIHYAERLLLQDPLREETYRHLMRLYSLSGDRMGLMRVYQTCIKVFKREINAEVSPEIKAAYEQLVRTQIAPKTPTDLEYRPRTNNLPVALTSFIGREKQITGLRQLLVQRSDSKPITRLLTLSGAGGCGKTRLALQVANGLTGAFKDGVWMVALASLSDPTLVSQAVASIFGVRVGQGKMPEEILLNYLETKELLLIFDNCEHLLGACAHLIHLLLQACPTVQILATSRERLNIPGEQVWQVTPLSFPDKEDSFETLKQSESVCLFVDRASGSLPSFEMNRQNAAGILQICTRLDGIPLAIELAAARVSVLTVEQIAGRLQDRFSLLVNGSRVALPKQQTLRAAIDWSYDLLSMEEKTLFGRMAVFSGGCTLEAAETVCSGAGLESVLDLLLHLVDKSLILVKQQQGEARFLMLETIRQYSGEKLRNAGEEALLRKRHCDYYLGLAEAAEPEFHGPDQRTWFNRMEVEHDNMRTALQWALESGNAALELRLAVALSWFLWVRGYFTEGRHWLNLGLASIDRGLNSIRAKAYEGLGHMVFGQGEFAQAEQLYGQSLNLCCELDDKDGIAWSYAMMGISAMYQGKIEQARDLYEKSLSLRREVGNNWHMAWVLAVFGGFLVRQSDHHRGKELIEESLELNRQLQNPWGCALSLINLARYARSQGEFERAQELLRESLKLRSDLGDKLGIARCLEVLAEIAASIDQPAQAARLYGSGKTLYEKMGDFTALKTIAFLPSSGMKGVSVELRDGEFAAAWAEGRAMTLDQAIKYALSGEH